MKRSFCVFMIFAIFSAMSLSARAAKRVALVIGNERYDGLAKLDNPVRDAQAVALILSAHGFSVASHRNLDFAAFRTAVNKFVDMSKGADEALIFYSGHGMGVAQDGQIINALAPTDADIDCTTRKARHVIALEDVLLRLAHVPKKVALFDACRNDPFPQCQGLTSRGFGFQPLKLDAPEQDKYSQSSNQGGTRGIGVSLTNSQTSLLVGYSSDLGGLAQDGKPGQHSPFAQSLLDELKVGSRRPFRELLDRTSARVTELTGSQYPWVVTKGGEPLMCLAGNDCQTSTALTNDRTLERSRRLARLSEEALSRSDIDSAIAFALEGLPDIDPASAGTRDEPYALEAHAALEQAMREGQKQRTFTGHQQGTIFLSYNKRGDRLVSSGYDEFAILWDTSNGKPVAKLEIGADPYVHHKLNPEGAIVATLGLELRKNGTATDKKVVLLWDAATGKRLFRIGAEGFVEILDFLDDDRILVSDARGVAIWDFRKQAKIGVIPTKQIGYVRAYPFAQGNKVALLTSQSGTGGSQLGSSTLELWDVANLKLLTRFSPHAGGVESAAISPDHSILLTGSEDRTLAGWDLNSGKRLFSIASRSRIHGVAFSPLGDRMAAVTHDEAAQSGDLLVWSLRDTSRPIITRSGLLHRGGQAVEFSSDGMAILVMSFSGRATVFSAANGSIIHRMRTPSLLAGQDGAVSSVAYSPGATEIAIGGDKGEITLWNIKGNTISPGLGPRESTLSFRPFAAPYKKDNEHISVQQEGHTYNIKEHRDQIFVTDAETGILFLQLKHQFDSISSIALDAQRNVIIAQGEIDRSGTDPEKQYQVWPFVHPLPQLIPLARERVLRCLAPSDREKAGLEKTPPNWCTAMRKPPYDQISATKRE